MRLIAIEFFEDTNELDDNHNEKISRNKIKKRATIVKNITADIENENDEEINTYSMRISIQKHDYISNYFIYNNYLWKVENLLETDLKIYLDCISEGIYEEPN